MSLRDDERAQTVQVGAILLLGTLVVALSVYQMTSVPGQNAETEFTHNQGVHEQLQEVRTAILETAAEGTGRYPRRRWRSGPDTASGSSR
ncbi:hypothetical protein BRD01_15000 [Halobacteriales archaeon QS_8_65_32]|jgi:hypothetical protein|nr:MAG: hypothetical protein BRD01_15000 [Halobacteriales archaeon QS_8_65_32]